MENTVKKKSYIPSEKHPPGKSKNVFSDIRYFFFNNPPKATFVKFKTFQDRLNIRESIMQRIGMDAGKYEVLNVHKIGVDAPANYIFDELMNWNGDSTCWPNHIAKVDRINDRIENIQILPFGRKTYPFGIKNGIFGFNFIPLFSLNAQKIQTVPDSVEADNARYLLYNCSGGYPIGFFTMYVRSSIEPINEKEKSQIFFVVGFDFFGRKNWTKNHIIVRIWLLIHNRVTQNVMNRFKELCEWRFEKIKGGEYIH
jgi:hypothetical protein